jgi:hypothetical protein
LAADESVTIKVQPYLRPAADAQYPKLADNIRKAYEKMGGDGAASTEEAPMAADPVAALVAALKADAAVAGEVTDRVFGGELPPGEAGAMPRKAIVLKPSGGVSITSGTNVAHDTQRIDVFTYGATVAEAAALMSTVALVLRWTQREVWAGTLIHWVNSAGVHFGA